MHPFPFVFKIKQQLFTQVSPQNSFSDVDGLPDKIKSVLRDDLSEFYSHCLKRKIYNLMLFFFF